MFAMGLAILNTLFVVVAVVVGGSLRDCKGCSAEFLTAVEQES